MENTTNIGRRDLIRLASISAGVGALSSVCDAAALGARGIATINHRSISADSLRYVQSGLVAQFDGHETIARGVNGWDGNWHDLVGSNDFSGNGGVAGHIGINVRGVSVAGGVNAKRYLSHYLDQVATGTYTIEIAFSATGRCGLLGVGTSFNTRCSNYFFVQTATQLLIRHQTTKTISGLNFFDGSVHTITAIVTNGVIGDVYIDGTFATDSTYNDTWSGFYVGALFYGDYSNTNPPSSISEIRLYNRILTADEVTANRALDVELFT